MPYENPGIVRKARAAQLVLQEQTCRHGKAHHKMMLHATNNEMTYCQRCYDTLVEHYQTYNTAFRYLGTSADPRPVSALERSHFNALLSSMPMSDRYHLVEHAEDGMDKITGTTEMLQNVLSGTCQTYRIPPGKTIKLIDKNDMTVVWERAASPCM